MSLPSSHAPYNEQLRTFLNQKAARYYADQESRHRLVERTIAAVTNDLSLIDDGDVAHALSRVLHRLAVEELRSSAARYENIVENLTVLSSDGAQMADPRDPSQPTFALAGRRCLVVEDEFYAASDLLSLLEAAGATVFGPVSHVERAIEVLTESSLTLDIAVLDINLNGQMVFPAATLLAKQGTPFVFLTGYENASVPAEFAQTPCLTKPCDNAALLKALASVVRPANL